MFLRPKRTKFKKEHRNNFKYHKLKNENLSFGSLGIVAVTGGNLTGRQIEAARRIIAKKIKRIGKLWICIFPNKPITKKPSESRMGKGKGDVSFWVAKVSPGTRLFEVEGISLPFLKFIVKMVSYKLPIGIKIVVWDKSDLKS